MKNLFADLVWSLLVSGGIFAVLFLLLTLGQWQEASFLYMRF